MANVVEPGSGAATQPAPTVAAPTGSDPNYTTFTTSNSWEFRMLKGLGLPVTKINVEILDAWSFSEGTINHNNPLAISGKNPGATTCLAQCGSSSPVMAYDSLASGVDATVNFIKKNGYSDVVATMAVNTFQNVGTQVPSGNLGAVWSAINNSGWCKGCQGGKYPIGLADLQNGIPVNFSGKNLVVTGTTINQTTPDQQGAVTPGLNFSVGDFLGGIVKNWKRILFGFFGILLILLGVLLMLSETKTGQVAEGVAKEVPL